MADPYIDKYGFSKEHILQSAGMGAPSADSYVAKYGYTKENILESAGMVAPKSTIMQPPTLAKPSAPIVEPEDVDMETLSGMLGIKPPTELSAPTKIVGQALRAGIETATLGAPRLLPKSIYDPPQPETTGEGIAESAGTLGGMVLGAPLKIAKGLVGKLAPGLKVKGSDKISKVFAKRFIEQTATLPLMEASGRLTQILTDPEGGEILKQSLYGGAEIGAQFGVLTQLAPFRKFGLDWAVRLGGKLAYDASVHGDHPFDEREIADKSYGYMLDLFFLKNGAKAKDVLRSVQIAEARGNIQEVRQIVDDAKDRKLITYEPWGEPIGGTQDFVMVPEALRGVHRGIEGETRQQIEFEGKIEGYRPPSETGSPAERSAAAILAETTEGNRLAQQAGAGEKLKTKLRKETTINRLAEAVGKPEYMAFSEKIKDITPKEQIDQIVKDSVGSLMEMSKNKNLTKQERIELEQKARDNAAALIEADGEITEAAVKETFASNKLRDDAIENMYTFGSPEMADKMWGKLDEIGDRFGVWAASKTPQKVKNFFDPFAGLKGGEDYYGKRLIYFGQQARLEEKIHSLFTEMQTYSPRKRTMAYDYLLGEKEPTTTRARKYIRAAIEAKKLIDRAGRNLVESGEMPEESYQKLKGKYLPRKYIVHLLAKEAGVAGTKLDRSYLKARKDIPEEVRELILGEIKDPGFLVSEAIGREWGDIYLTEFMADIAKNPDWAYSGGLTYWSGFEALTTMSKKVSRSRRIYSAPFIKQELNKLWEIAERQPARAEEIKAIIKEGQEALLRTKDPDRGENWVKVPEDARLGSLRGMWVRPEIANDLKIGMGLGQKTITASEKLTQIFKIAKVPMNIPSQFRNMFSNTILLDLSGMNHIEQSRYFLKVVEEITNNGNEYRDAKRFGLSKTTFTRVELRNIREYAKALNGGHLSVVNHIAKVGVKPFLKAYETIEQAGKLGRFMFEKDNLTEQLIKDKGYKDKSDLTLKEKRDISLKSSVEAQAALFDYSRVSPLIDKVRRSWWGAPFITFQYKALPVVAKALVTRPHVLAKYVAIPFVLQAFLQENEDISNAEWGRLKRMLPHWINRYGVWVLPTKDKNGKVQFVDFSYFMPWGQFMQVGEAIAGGVTGETKFADVYDELRKDTGFGGAPLLQFASFILSKGRDPFTQRSVYEPSDTSKDQVIKTLGYMWNLMTPTMLQDKGVLGHVMDFHQGKTDRYGVPLSASNAYLRGVGVNIYPADEKTALKQYRVGQVAKIKGLVKELVRITANKGEFAPTPAGKREKKERQAKIRQQIKTIRKETIEATRRGGQK